MAEVGVYLWLEMTNFKLLRTPGVASMFRLLFVRVLKVSQNAKILNKDYS